MKETTLFVRVGRAEPKPLVTVESSNVSQLNAAEKQKLDELVSGGVDPQRVKFSRHTSGNSVSTVKKGKSK